MRFEKAPKTLQEHVELLLSRGLIIPNPERASRYLRVIGYYRISAYLLELQQGDHTSEHHKFLPGVTFDDVLSLYIFDRKLRLCLFDALERVEIAVRASMIDSLCLMSNNAYWHLDPSNFGTRFDSKYSRPFNHEDFVKKINAEDEVFLKHYRRTYEEPAQPPA